VSSAPLDAIWDEVVDIADGRPRAEIEQRARQAFTAANDARARLDTFWEIDTRREWTTRADTWAEILRHMDDTGETTFCGCPCGCCQCPCHGDCDDSCLPPRRLRDLLRSLPTLPADLALLLPQAIQIFRQGLREDYGTTPVEFYHFPDNPGTTPEATPPPAQER
jgi:hypothetical protein